jgi:hypothetical protein
MINTFWCVLVGSTQWRPNSIFSVKEEGDVEPATLINTFWCVLVGSTGHHFSGKGEI